MKLSVEFKMTACQALAGGDQDLQTLHIGHLMRGQALLPASP